MNKQTLGIDNKVIVQTAKKRVIELIKQLPDNAETLQKLHHAETILEVKK